MSTMTQLDNARERLAAIGQEHLLAFFDELDETSQSALLAQIEAIDLDRVPGWVADYVENKPDFAPNPDDLAPPSYYACEGDWDREKFKTIGEDLLRTGKVAAFTVAGGQGSRLGYDGPKGEFPAGAVSKKPLFAFFADWLLAAGQRYGVTPVWCIMTSPLNHERTVAFFEKNNYFSLDPQRVRFFNQGTMPSFDMKTSKILLAEKGAIATNPDGHGGSLKALYESGAIAEMRELGVEHISYFHVDNPIVRVIDPVFIGLHVGAGDSSGEMSSKMIPKAEPSEKVGVFGVVKGQTQVIEYSDMPEELAHATDDRGGILYNAASIGIHMLSVDFVAKFNESQSDFSLPFHRAEKKVACVDPVTGNAFEPTEPNAVKLEMFVFDAIPFAKQSLIYETDRINEFAPIKNAEGKDSAASSAEIQTERAARMLEKAGFEVPRDANGTPACTLEMSPQTAMEWGDLKGVQVPGLKAGDLRAF
ncbi:MAG: UDPGP type 1 family protein [Planctomycetota bacterium]